MKKLLYTCLASLFLFACAQDKATETPSGRTLVKVDGSTITEKDVKDELQMLPPEVMEIFEEEGGAETLLKELVKKEMIYQEALKKGLQKTDTFMTRLEVLKKRLMVEMLLEEEIEKKVAVSDEEVRDFYEKNRKRFEAETPGNDKKSIMEFEVVEGRIRQALTAEKQRKAFDDFINTLQEKYTVVMDQDAINAAFGNRTTP